MPDDLTKKEKWNNLVVDLARHLCEEKGEQYPSDVKILNKYIEKAEQYLEQRTLNKYFWENLCGCMNDEGNQ